MAIEKLNLSKNEVHPMVDSFFIKEVNEIVTYEKLTMIIKGMDKEQEYTIRKLKGRE